MKRGTVLAILAASALLGWSGCGSSGASLPDQLFTEVKMKSPVGQQEVLLKPPGLLRGLVLFEHGYGGNQNLLTRTSAFFPLRDALLTRGYALAASYSHGNNMGSPASVHDQVLLLDDAERRLPPVPAVEVVGVSMGGLDALMVASRHVLPKLDGVVLLSPMCDQEPFLRTRSSLEKDIRAVYGPHKTGAALLDAIAVGNPERQDPHSYAGYRYWFWQSPNDPIVPASQSAGMVAVLKRAGVPVQLSELPAGHVNLRSFEPDRIAFWFLAGG